MFTVVITEQAYLDKINQYKAFLKPFLGNKEVALCCWRKHADNLTEAVPDLFETVARHSAWRAVVVCDDPDGLLQKNPFDLTHFDPGPAPMEEIDEEDPELRKEKQEKAAAQWKLLCHEKKLEVFREAAQKPLTKLMTWLCRSPLVSEGMDHIRNEDPQFAVYEKEFRAKEQLRHQILNGQVPDIALPREVICVAPRCYNRESMDIYTSWSNQPDILYSRFYDWNLYFDKMRYLIFDILPTNHRNYEFDFIRFLYTLMLVANNEVPMGSLKPNRVYMLECHDNEGALRRLLARYEAKLAITQAHISDEIQKLKNREMPRLSDNEAEQIFRSGVSVQVSAATDFDERELYISSDRLSLSTNCPSDEELNWDVGVRISRKALGRFLKQPRRNVKKAAAQMRRNDTADLEFALQLNEFQLEDVAEYTAEEELRMVNTRIYDLYDIRHYNKRLDTRDKQVRSVIDTRMTRGCTIGIGVAALLSFLIGFIPLFITNNATAKSVLFSLAFTLAAVGVMIVTCLITLLALRRPLRKGYRSYNNEMQGVVSDVERAVEAYAQYLSHACNVMRGHSVLNYCSEHENPEEGRIRVLRKHEVDLECQRQELRDVFGNFLPEKLDPEECGEIFDYDFSRPVDFAYPIPFTADQVTRIEFMQKGNLVNVPVDFVKRITIRREELYDA